MRTKAEILTRRLHYLTSEVGTNENLKEIEEYIDNRLDVTAFQSSHRVCFHDLKARLLTSEGEFRDLLKVIVLRYQLAGWTVSVSDTDILFE